MCPQNTRNMKEKRILDVLLRSNIGDMKDEELNELKEIVNKEYEKRQEKRRELLESIKKGYISCPFL